MGKFLELYKHASKSSKSSPADVEAKAKRNERDEMMALHGLSGLLPMIPAFGAHKILGRMTSNLKPMDTISFKDSSWLKHHKNHMPDKHLQEMIESAKLTGKLDVLEPGLHTLDRQMGENAFFMGYNSDGKSVPHTETPEILEQLKARRGYTTGTPHRDGTIGQIHATTKKMWKPGIMAHEIGHANIHDSKGLVGFLQRKLYGPTMLANKLGLGLLPSIGAYKLVGKDDDSVLSGGLKGGLVGAAANAGALIPEFEASRRGIKYMKDSSMSKGRIKANSKALLPAFLTYLSTLAGPSAAVGGLKAYFNKKHKQKAEDAI